MVARIRKNDVVKILSGKDKGKQGEVIQVLPAAGKVLVKNIAVVTKHVKARKQGEISEIKKQETFIDASKVMLICNACHTPARINAKQSEHGKRVRVCNRCEQIT